MVLDKSTLNTVTSMFATKQDKMNKTCVRSKFLRKYSNPVNGQE